MSAKWHSTEVAIAPDVHFAPIVLKNSEFAGLRKSRKCSALAISAAAGRCKIDTRAGDRFCGNSCGPSPRSERGAPAVLRIFSHQRKRTFSTQSARSCHSWKSVFDPDLTSNGCRTTSDRTHLQTLSVGIPPRNGGNALGWLPSPRGGIRFAISPFEPPTEEIRQ
jgi:hypothetical protein